MSITLKKGILIAIEGIDGSGKSTLAKKLYTTFLQAQYPVLLTKEPGATILGQHLRTLVQEKKFPICSKAEFLLFAADRAQHFDEFIIPGLARGSLIISDRMADSSLVYQGQGRGLSLDMIKSINKWTMNEITPDLTLYIKVSTQIANERISTRNEALTSFEKEKQTFFQKLIEGFDALYKQRNDVIIIDGSQSLDAVSTQAYRAITSWITQNQLIHV